MLTVLLIGIIVLILFVAFLFVLPIAFIKVIRAEKQKCPNCENEIRFPQNHGKCPKCKAKLFKHADGTLHLKS